jgi:hypothetical protein
VILALLGTGTAVLFLAADVLRGSRPHAATLISLAGWVLLGAATLSWARAGRPWGRLWRRAARVAVLAVVAAAVLLVYLEHSHVLEAGTNVDAVYTWIGLSWVFALDNPITFVGRTPSYPGSPLMLLSHLPAMAVGFARLGPLAIHLGLLLTVSGLLALMVVLLTPTASLGRQAAAVALAAGCLSTRFVVQGYDAIGYAIAGVCLGFALIAALAVEDAPRRDRAIGGLIALGTLHYSYVGLGLALPLCAAWLLLRRHPIREIRAFLSANPILLLIILLMAITVTTHPEMALKRAYDVVAGVASKVPLQTSLAKKLASPSFAEIATTFYQRWYIQNQGSWLLVDLAPLGGPSLWLLAAMWVCSWIAAPHRVVATTASMIGFLALLTGLSLLQHIVTDHSDYRDFPLVFAVTAAGLLFILRAPALAGPRAAIAWGAALLVAAVNFGDVALLAGHRHASADYAPQEVAVFEALRQHDETAEHGWQELGASRLVVTVADTLVPIRKLYVDLLTARGFKVTTPSTSAFCRNRDDVVRAAAKASCDPFLLAVALTACRPDANAAQQDRVVVLHYNEPCPATRDTAAKPSPSIMLLGVGSRR